MVYLFDHRLPLTIGHGLEDGPTRRGCVLQPDYCVLDEHATKLCSTRQDSHVSSVAAR